MRCGCVLSACIAVASMPACSRCAHDAVGAVLRAREHEHRVHARCSREQLHEQRALPLARHRIHRVRHRARRRRAPPDLHHDRLAQVLARERLDLGRHRRAEQQRLAVRAGSASTMRLICGAKPMSSMRSASSSTSTSRSSNTTFCRSRWSMQAARRRDDDVDAGAQRLLLRLERHAAEHRTRRRSARASRTSGSSPPPAGRARASA